MLSQSPGRLRLRAYPMGRVVDECALGAFALSCATDYVWEAREDAQEGGSPWVVRWLSRVIFGCFCGFRVERWGLEAVGWGMLVLGAGSECVGNGSDVVGLGAFWVFWEQEAGE